MKLEKKFSSQQHGPLWERLDPIGATKVQLTTRCMVTPNHLADIPSSSAMMMHSMELIAL